jgi:ASC-1-like (ASCH) protein
MEHQMNLWHGPFTKIEEGSKTIEMRLYDEKRSLIRTGDAIVFTDVSTGRKIRCEVLNLYRYPSFDELYANHSSRSIGYEEGEEADPKDMQQYYTPEETGRYGVVGIEIRII